MKYRSISSHRGCPDPQVIELAAQLGFNDVCFQVEGDQAYMLRELRDRWNRGGLAARIKELGMTISLWVHEFEDLEPDWGEPSLENVALWEGLKKRYRRLLIDSLPEIDWLVLTVVESSVRVTDPGMLEKLILMLREVCHECGRKLMVRSFVWTLEEFEGVREAIARLPDDVTVMTKYVPQDWHRGDNHDPLIGQVGDKDQMVELDIAGEYFRGDYLGHCFASELHARFQYWVEQGVDGLSVRIDRGWRPWLHHDNILHEVQESNLWCLGMWMTGAATDTTKPLEAWATARFGATASEHITEIAKLCDPVVKEALTVCGEPFGDTRRIMPALRSMLPPKEDPATVYQPAKAANHVDPFSRWLALWRWDNSLISRYEKLRRGDPSCIRHKTEGYSEALAKSNEALSLLEQARATLETAPYEFLRFKLEENRHHLILMCEAALAWLACLQLPTAQQSEKPQISSVIEKHLEAMHNEWLSHNHESAVVIWPQGQTRQLKRCEYLDVPGFCQEMRRYACLPS